ncbi:hypothetical protein CKO51_12030 [Rhodopirellula sp. SM50]|nr:class I SAM-dependent methyltransferase [Rhodopirellula sp. SM50]PAY19334.1 hypothetical protein CKO51_12030 [Rhodopirellula sp. SM50]
MLEDSTCPYCGSERLRLDYSLPWGDERFSGYEIVSCRSCPFSFASPFPDPETLRRLYDSLEYQDTDRKGGNPTSLSPTELDALVARESAFYDKYSELFGSTGNVLDIGAGWGLLLKHFEHRGWDAHGIELSKVQAYFARQQLLLNVHQASVDELHLLELPQLDLVVMRHTLEHFSDPRRVLSMIGQRCNRESRLIIEVPDYHSYDRRAYGRSWPAFGPWHLWYFSQKSLTRLLADTGFRPLRFDRFLSDRVCANPASLTARMMRKIINRVGGKHLFSGRSIGVIAEKIAEGQD